MAMVKRLLKHAFILISVTTCFNLAYADEVEARCDSPAATLEVAEGAIEVLTAGSGSWQKAEVDSEFCYGDAIKVLGARAALRLDNDTLLRLNQGAVVNFLPPESSFWVEVAEGIAHFVSRTPKPVKVKTPYLNAAIEGTEFVVLASTELCSVSVFEGNILASNDYGSIKLSASQTASAAKGQAPKLDPGANLRNTVSWAFNYPLLGNLLSSADKSTQTKINNGDYLGALVELESAPASIDNLNLKTALALSIGQTSKATEYNTEALKQTPNSTEALSAKAITELTLGERDKAKSTISSALATAPNNATLLLTDSYIKQAFFDLEGALASAVKAAEQAPNNSEITLRVAELALHNEDLDLAKASLATAKNLNAAPGEVAKLQGVIDLKELKYKKAKQQFELATTKNNRDPLAHFLLGLTQIRLGQQDEGRQQVELAVLLDPNNSLYRSYLGKIYSDEFRFEQAEEQFNLAKQLDEDDPTPYFYQAVQYQSQGAPTLAIREINKSIDRNDNRAVYRSRFQLDSDTGARSASLAKMYLDLNMEAQAEYLASKAKLSDSSEFLPYKTLADIRATEPRSSSAATSEYLQAQIRQPITSMPIRPSTTSSHSNIAPSSGPSSLGISEYNSLTAKNGTNILTSIAKGSEETISYDAMISGAYKQHSFLYEQYKNISENLTGNGSQNLDVKTAYFQTKPNLNSNIFITYQNSEIEQLEIKPFNDNPEGNAVRLVENFKSLRVGGMFQLHPNASILATTGYKAGNVDQYDEVFFMQAPPVDVTFIQNELNNQDIADLGLAFDITSNTHNIFSGIDYNRINSDQRSYRTTLVNEVPNNPIESSEDKDISFQKAYAYWNFQAVQNFSVLLGISHLTLDDEDTFYQKFEKTASKLGMNFSTRRDFDISLAYFETLHLPSNFSTTLEPTHIFTINQLMDYNYAAEIETYSVKANYFLGNYLLSGSTSKSNIDTPIRDITEEITTIQETEERKSSLLMSRAYKYTAISIAANISSIDTNRTYTTSFAQPVQLDTKEIPIQISIFNNKGFIAALEYKRIFQFDETPTTTGNSQQMRNNAFSIIDLELKYLISGIAGKSLEFSLNFKNLMDEDFSYIDADIYSERTSNLGYSSGRFALGKMVWIY